MLYHLREKKNIIIEPHNENYNGYPFVSLIQYKKQFNYVCIIDNVDNKQLKAYVLDLCDAEKVCEQKIIDSAINWYDNDCKYPISIQFTKDDINNDTSKIYKVFSLENIDRIIGNVYYFNLAPSKIKKRKCRIIPSTCLHQDNL